MINIQDKLNEIHNKYGISELSIQLLFEEYVKEYADKKLIEETSNFDINVGKSLEWDSMMIEFNHIANDIFEKYGPEGSYEINKIISKLIQNDTNY